jgi:hypothetical protein
MEDNKNNAGTNKPKDLNKFMDEFLNKDQDNLDCSSGVCVIKGDKSLVERINKKIITEDGRQLLY